MNPINVDVARMRQRITLQSLSTTVSAVGQQVPTWSNVGTYWAEVVTTGGDLSENGDQLKPVLVSKVTMRQLGINGPTIVPGSYRFQFNGRTLNITSVVALDNQNIYWEIMTKERVGF